MGMQCAPPAGRLAIGSCLAPRSETASTLEKESGVPALPDSVRTFRAAITEGAWDAALRAVSKLQVR